MSWVNQASDYAALGLSVIPVAGKVAAIKWEPWQRSIMPSAEIQRCFSSPVVSGIAVVLGPVSGELACRDFDVPESYQAWRTYFPAEAERLPTAKTPRGHHVYFRHAGVGTRHFGDGEIRGEGSYCVLPNSVVKGVTYHWLRPFGGEFMKLDPEKTGLTQPWNRMNREDREDGGDREDLADRANYAVDTFGDFPKNEIRSLEQAVSVATPHASHENHRMLFHLARAMLAYQKHSALVLAETDLMEAFAMWHKAALPHLRQCTSYDEYLFEFLEAWERARFPLGERAVIREAWLAASAAEPPATASKKLSDPRLLLLASFCRELQRRAGTQPFYLACRTVQERFNLSSHVTGYNWLLGLVRVNILDIAERGTRGVKGRATRFRYLPLD
jgi:Bifunctional DNA primase/polymerase, N-terminal